MASSISEFLLGIFTFAMWIILKNSRKELGEPKMTAALLCFAGVGLVLLLLHGMTLTSVKGLILCMILMWAGISDIHADLVYRGDEATAQKFLDAQDDYFRYLEEHPETDNPGEETDDTGEGFDIVKHANDIINGNVPAYIPGQEGDGNE